MLKVHLMPARRYNEPREPVRGGREEAPPDDLHNLGLLAATAGVATMVASAQHMAKVAGLCRTRTCGRKRHQPDQLRPPLRRQVEEVEELLQRAVGLCAVPMKTETLTSTWHTHTGRGLSGGPDGIYLGPKDDLCDRDAAKLVLGWCPLARTLLELRFLCIGFTCCSAIFRCSTLATPPRSGATCFCFGALRTTRESNRGLGLAKQHYLEVSNGHYLGPWYIRN